MDINDILREVDPTTSTVPRKTRDLQALTRCWVAERSAPELLSYVFHPPEEKRSLAGD
jgi:GINS complex subunit 4